MIYTISVRGNGADVVAADGFRWYEAWPEGEEPDTVKWQAIIEQMHAFRGAPGTPTQAA